MTPPGRESHWLRNVSVGVVGVMVVLAVLGSASRPRDNAPANPAPEASSDTGSPTDSASPAPPGQTLLSFEGTGPATSDPFQASGESVEVMYDYTCTTEDSFTLNFYGANTSPVLPDVLVSEFGAQGTSTLTESLNDAAGPFHVEVDSLCAWSIEVVGAP